MALKGPVSRTHEFSEAALDSVELLQRGFIYGNLKMIEALKGKLAPMAGREEALVSEFSEETKASPAAAIYIGVPHHLSEIAGAVLGAAEGLEARIREDVLFSDKAVDEVNFLLEKLKDILSNTGEMILARNNIIAGYIKEAQADIERVANDFETKHEERLIEGICLPKASAIYISVVDAVKSAAWHAREIAQELRGT